MVLFFLWCYYLITFTIIIMFMSNVFFLDIGSRDEVIQ